MKQEFSSYWFFEYLWRIHVSWAFKLMARMELMSFLESGLECCWILDSIDLPRFEAYSGVKFPPM